jgi:hypothetical protein
VWVVLPFLVGPRLRNPRFPESKSDAITEFIQKIVFSLIVLVADPEHAISLVRARYADFGPTFAAEKLAERHDLAVSRETLRSDEISDAVQHRRRIESSICHDGGGSIDGESAGGDRQAPQQSPLCFRQQIMAPIERRTQCPLPRQRRAAAGRQ